MRHRSNRHRVIRNATIALVLFLGTASQATAAGTSALRLVTPAAAYLAAHPGGQVLNTHEVSYDRGAFVVTLGGVAGIAAAPNCPAGWFCFWDQSYFVGNRGKLSSCYWQNLGTYGWANRVNSAYYNLSGGAVQFMRGSVPLFQIGVADRSEPNAGPNIDLANSVYRYC